MIRIRIQGLDANAVSQVVENVSGRFSDELANGALVTLKSTKTTCHRLPIGGLD